MSHPSGGGTVLWDLDARGVGTLAFNRPEVHNAYNGELIQGVHEALDALTAERGLRVVVLRGNGKHFQAGADLRWAAEVARGSLEENERVSGATAEAERRLDGLSVPTVALVQGGCFGGGTGFVAACDVVVASEDAIFSIGETRWGLMSGALVREHAATCRLSEAAEGLASFAEKRRPAWYPG
jgi:methylglutaconyl-CoA hydratase